jgi:hypothetical protein
MVLAATVRPGHLFSFLFLARYSNPPVRVNSPRYLFQPTIVVSYGQNVAQEANAVRMTMKLIHHKVGI